MPEQTGTVPRPNLLPEELDQVEDRDSATGNWIVIVWNNDHNTFEEVISILQQATGCPLAEAELETWEVHNLGKSLVHHGDRAECERAAAIIRTIGIRVTVTQL